MSYLTIRGARQHNLQGVDLRLPRNQLVVITGPSGSGKSSLAFDTIYAEGQRRYVESLSAYARQFLEQLPKPDVESIEGLSPAIAIQQKSLGRSPRSTVGTVTEIADYLRLLFARVGTPHCPRSGKVLRSYSVQEIVDKILSKPDGTRLSLLAPIEREGTDNLAVRLERLRREGFVRARVNGDTFELSDLDDIPSAQPYQLEVVVDRIVVKPTAQARITDSIELALKLGDGSVLVDYGDNKPPSVFSQKLVSWEFGISLPPLEPRLFSFNSPHGACELCNGLGSSSHVSSQRVVPDANITLREGAVSPFGPRGSLRMAGEVQVAVATLGIDADIPWGRLPEAKRNALLHGAPAGGRGRTKKPAYCGIVSRIDSLLRANAQTIPLHEDQDDIALQDEVALYATTGPCTDCQGTRLCPEALSVRVLDKTIAEFCNCSLTELRETLAAIVDGDAIDSVKRSVATPLIEAMVKRLGFLEHVGLGYLSLERPVQTLSGGEGQRIRLATQIGAALVGVLYVLDEPSVGLHAQDNEKLLTALRQLVEKGNSVLVVEHDRDAMLHADYLVDMGPAAGRLGGTVVAQGTPDEVIANGHSVTGPYISGAKTLALPTTRKRPQNGKVLRLVGASAHNLQNVTLEIPLGLLTVVTGVSGAGKSALIIATLLAAARSQLHGSVRPVGPYQSLEGLSALDKVVSIDQTALGRTPRSNPATYTGIFTQLRELFAALPDSRARGYKAGRFSFNVKGGRCEACAGDGVRRVEMHFLPDVYVDCSSCLGRRYNRETLEVRYRGLSISDVLNLTVDEAGPIFESIPKLRQRLDALRNIGLGYIQLGQSATTLSGGEAQRVKLASELAKTSTGSTLYVLDEPTSGLHFSDIEMLLTAIYALRDAGNTVILIEHNLDVARCADWLVDIGPGPGRSGGQIVVCGPPQEVALSPLGATARFLKVLEAGLPNQPKSRSTRS